MIKRREVQREAESFGWHLVGDADSGWRLEKDEPLFPLDGRESLEGSPMRWEAPIRFSNLKEVKQFLDGVKKEHPLETLTLKALKENQ